jgi:hypothetical protein
MRNSSNSRTKYYLKLNRRLQRHQQNVAYFQQQTLPQAECEFLRLCFEPCSDSQRQVALGIRLAIAKLGQVEPAYIRSDVCFADLNPLPQWEYCGDVGFDTMIFIDAIAVNLDVCFSSDELRVATVRDPDIDPSMKIYEFIQEFYFWFASRKP